MRLGELFVILLSLVLANLSFLVKKKWTLGAALLLIPNLYMMQALSEGFRWPLIILYLSLLPFFLTQGFRKEKPVLPYLGYHALLLLTSFLLILFPAVDLPRPLGPFGVGTLDGEWTVDGRVDLLAPQEGLPRRLGWQVWYPSQGNLLRPKAPWMRAGSELGPLTMKVAGLPGFLFHYLDQIKTSSRERDEPLLNLAPYPLVIMSHGWLGFRNLHTDMAEELASRGFVVLSIDHTYGAVATALGEEEIVKINSEILPEGLVGQPFIDREQLLVSTFGQDISDIFQALERKELLPVEIGNLVQTDQVGLLGYSTGGGGGVWAVLSGSVKVQALISWDPWVETLKEVQIQKVVNTPWLVIESEGEAARSSQKNLKLLLDNAKGETKYLVALGMKTWDFTQLYAINPLFKGFSSLGSREAREGTQGVVSETVRFFQQHLGAVLPLARETGTTADWLVP